MTLYKVSNERLVTLMYVASRGNALVTKTALADLFSPGIFF